MDLIKLSFASISHSGYEHTENQDACACLGPITLYDGNSAYLFLLSDGMGGHEHGKEAATSVVKTLTEFFNQHPPDESLCAWLQDAVQHAHTALYAEGKNDNPLTRRGATLTALLVVGQYACSVTIGDSRLYRIKDGYITQLSNDQTREGNLTQALGYNKRITIETQPLALTVGDRLMLCSDGLYREVSDDELLNLLKYQQPAQALEKMLMLALERGGHDNISAIIIDSSATRRKLSRKTALFILLFALSLSVFTATVLNSKSNVPISKEKEELQSFPTITPQKDLMLIGTSRETLEDINKQLTGLTEKTEQTIDQYKSKGYPEKIENIEHIRDRLMVVEKEIKLLQQKVQLDTSDLDAIKNFKAEIEDSGFNLGWLYRDAVVLPNRLEKPQ